MRQTNPERLRAIARDAAEKNGRRHTFTSEEAREAGMKGLEVRRLKKVLA